MRFKGLDLNLLVAFDALMETRSVSRAAGRLHLSQPAMSAALARLRTFFGDELLLAQGKRMYPTAHAEALLSEVRAALGHVESVIATSRHFEPASSNRAFRLVASDYIATAILAPLVGRLEQIAPGVRLELSLPNERRIELLATGAVDLLITLEPYVTGDMPSELLFQDRFVVVGRAGHPALAAGLDLDAYLAHGHVVVGIGESRLPSFGDRHLDMLGIKRNIEVIAPTFASAPWFLGGTDWLTLMHARLAQAMQRHFPLALAEPPIDIPPLREMAQFHPTRAADPGLRWLIDQIRGGAD